MWNDAENIISILEKNDIHSPSLYFELAPTGYIHVGILRTFLSIKNLNYILRDRGFQTKTILGLGNRDVLKKQNNFPTFNNYIRNQLINVPSPKENSSSYFDFFLKDIKKSLELIDFDFDEFYSIGDIYSKANIDYYFPLLFQKQDEIKDTLSLYQKTIPNLYFPKCDSCGQLYESKVYSFDKESNFEYNCNNCGHKGKSNLYDNNGSFSFKLETAIKIFIKKIDIQFAGFDHHNAFEVARELHEIIFGASPKTYFYIINLTLNQKRKVVHKSLGNYKPITEYSDVEFKDLLELLGTTDESKLLKIPKKFAKKHYPQQWL